MDISRIKVVDLRTVPSLLGAVQFNAYFSSAVIMRQPLDFLELSLSSGDSIKSCLIMACSLNRHYYSILTM